LLYFISDLQVVALVRTSSYEAPRSVDTEIPSAPEPAESLYAHLKASVKGMMKARSS
jgi:hypothetical protein